MPAGWSAPTTFYLTTASQRPYDIIIPATEDLRCLATYDSSSRREGGAAAAASPCPS